MANYGHIIFFSLIGGIFSLIGGIIMLAHKRVANVLAEYSTPFAAGALLAAVFMDLLKDGLEESTAETVMFSAMLGIVLFFFAERFLHWFHHHHQHEENQPDPTTGLVIVGDTLHNALDGVAIAAAFLISVPTGIVTTIAVAAHEIPQEIGDFGLLLAKGMRRRAVLMVNVLSAIATTLMAVLTFRLGSQESLPNGLLLGLSAGFLLYIAMSDLIPEIHQQSQKKRLLSLQPILLLLGVLTVTFGVNLAHSFIDAHKTHMDYSDLYQPAVCRREGKTGQVAYDRYGDLETQRVRASYGCETLPECDFATATIEGDPLPAPCFLKD